ncbi:hypothetical protein IE53DRAFT_411766 [Violaceomyces palustris]|uniref:Uncharacterized protein n=1 Tax=Violaceomyces palustris TaxID=1673888 RepID=A0ACD0NTW5_9BASI|nr:hypothetical protein IE53DRAFT_411766 [Violaceomyces palustris]
MTPLLPKMRSSPTTDGSGTRAPLKSCLKVGGSGQRRSRSEVTVTFDPEPKFRTVRRYLREFHEEGDGPTVDEIKYVIIPENKHLESNPTYLFLSEVVQAIGATAAQNSLTNQHFLRPKKKKKPEEELVLSERTVRGLAFQILSEQLRSQSTNVVNEVRAGLAKYRAAARLSPRGVKQEQEQKQQQTLSFEIESRTSTSLTSKVVVRVVSSSSPPQPSKEVVKVKIDPRRGSWVYGKGKVYFPIVPKQVRFPSSIPVHVSRSKKVKRF